LKRGRGERRATKDARSAACVLLMCRKVERTVLSTDRNFDPESLNLEVVHYEVITGWWVVERIERGTD